MGYRRAGPLADPDQHQTGKLRHSRRGRDSTVPAPHATQEYDVRYFLRRLLFYVVALWTAATLDFLLPRLMPGHPIDAFLQRYRDQIAQNPHFLDSLRIELGAPNQPLAVQYVHFLGNLLHGNLGISYEYYPTPVTTIIQQTLPWTLFLAGSATILTFMVGTFLGMIVAWRRGGALDSVLPPVLIFTSAFPAFFIALLLLYFLAFNTGWFPLSHSYSGETDVSLNVPFFKDVLGHAVLPVLAIMLTGAGGWMLGMRNVMINTLAEDFITMAQAKGLSD